MTKNKSIIFTTFSVIYIIAMGILIATYDIDNIEKVVYCKIDSIITIPKYENTPELIIKYHTDCNSIISSNKVYKIGDSIMVTTFIIQ